MEVFFGFGQLIAQDLSGSQAVEDTNVMLGLDCFHSYFGKQRRAGSIQSEQENVQAAGGELLTPFGRTPCQGNFKIPLSMSCPSPSPQRCESLSIPVEALQALILNVSLGAGGAVMAPGTCQTGSHPSGCPRVMAALANCTGCAEAAVFV